MVRKTKKNQKHTSKPSIDKSFIFIFYTNYYTVYVKLVPIKCKIKSMDLIILFSKFSKKFKNWIKCVNEVYSFLINNGSNLLKKKKSMVLYNNI